MSKQLIDKYEGKVTSIEWYDALQNEFDREVINHTVDGKELLAIKTSYGKIAKVGKSVICLLQEETDNFDNYDLMIIIPRAWIKSPAELCTGM